MENRMRGNAHVRLGGGLEETERIERPPPRLGPTQSRSQIRLAQRAVDQVRRDEWNAHDRSHTPAGRWVKGTRCTTEIA